MSHTVSTVGKSGGHKIGRKPAFVGIAARTGGVYVEHDDALGGGGMSVHEALVAAKLDYTVDVVEGVNVPVISDTGVTSVKFDDHRATVRRYSDGRIEPGGIVKSRYTAVGPLEAFVDVGQTILGDFGANIAAAGSYAGGNKSYVAFRLPEPVIIGGRDRYDMYLTLLNSIDGSSSLSGVPAPLRQDCTNQTPMHFGRGAEQRFEMRHTGDPLSRVAEIKSRMMQVNQWADAFDREMTRMLDVEVTRQKFEDIVRTHLLDPKTGNTVRSDNAYQAKVDDLMALYTQADTQEFGRGTAYAAYQAFVEWQDHLAPSRNGVLGGYTRIMDGRTDAIKVKAYNLFASV